MNASNLTVERLKLLLMYEPETGVFIRRTQTAPNALVGSVAGWTDCGYVRVSIDGKKHLAHLLAWLYMTGEWPISDIDHRDMDRANNRWSNLRLATRSQNAINSGRRSTNKSGLKGVSWSTKSKKWYASITINYKQMNLGVYSCKACAHFVYLIAADKHFGEFARAS